MTRVITKERKYEKQTTSAVIDNNGKGVMMMRLVLVGIDRGSEGVVFFHKAVDRCQVAAEMLTALNDLKTKGTLKKFVGTGSFVDKIDDGCIGNDISRLLDDLEFRLGDRRDGLV